MQSVHAARDLEAGLIRAMSCLIYCRLLRLFCVSDVRGRHFVNIFPPLIERGHSVLFSSSGVSVMQFRLCSRV
jgi:hypothetical protein